MKITTPRLKVSELETRIQGGMDLCFGPELTAELNISNIEISIPEIPINIEWQQSVGFGQWLTLNRFIGNFGPFNIVLTSSQPIKAKIGGNIKGIVRIDPESYDVPDACKPSPGETI